MTKPLRHTTLLVAALVAAVAAALAAPAAHAAPATLQQATNTCWKDVINDWIQHEPNIVGTYALQCYSQAIQHLNAMPDVSGYSSAPDDIQRALLAAMRQDRGGGPGSGLGGGGTGPGGNSGGGTPQGPGGGSSDGGGSSGGGSSGGHHGFLGLGSSSSATAIPLPLIVLGALAILLALAALATWLARRFQTRRPAPAPAVVKRR